MATNNYKATKPGLVLFFLILFIAGCESVSFAQSASTYTSVSATIINPITISKNINSEFGNVAVIVSGVIELSPADKNQHHGEIVLPVSSGTFTAASFYFTGKEGYGFTVSSPATPLVISNGQTDMHVKSFDSAPVQNEGSGMISGVYISVSPSRVTVNYN
jgi:hypothetical protein